MSTAVPRRRSRRWIVYFVVLAALGVAAIVTPLIYNMSVQLRPEQLADARRRWRDNSPANYDLECLINNRRGGQEGKSQYRAQVRGGHVVAVVVDGELVYVEASLASVAGCAAFALSEDTPERYDMAALFDEMESALRQSAAAERRWYLKADFEADGHPSHYVSYVPSTKDRIEWFVKLSPVR
jgi:hypothetical protein